MTGKGTPGRRGATLRGGRLRGPRGRREDRRGAGMGAEARWRADAGNTAAADVTAVWR